jgi:SSS family solute:Na+ symporter
MEYLGTIDFIVIVGSILGLVALGIYFTKKGAVDMDAFFVSGRSLPWYIAGTSMIATSFAADTPLWVTNLVRSQGIHYIWQFWAPLIGSALAVVYFGRKWRRMAFVTDVELMEARYGGGVAKVLRGWSGAWGALVICPLISAWVIKAMETILRESMGFPPDYQVAVTMAVVGLAVLMCGFSGLFGVVYTDFVQFLLATFGTVLLAIMSVQAVGGLDALVAKLQLAAEWPGNEMRIAPEIGSGAGQMSIWNAIGYFGFLWIGVALSGGYQAQRLLASKSAAHASYAQLLFTICYYALMAWPWIIVALCSIVLMPDLGVGAGDEGSAYPRMIVTILPIGLRGLLVVALIAAFISTISTLLNWGSSYLVNDIYRRFINRNAAEKSYVVIGRLATVLMAVAGASISLMADNIQTLLALFYVISSAAIVPGLLRWLWWRINGPAELIAMVSGWVVTLLLLVFKVFDAPMAALLGLPEGVLFSSDENLIGARMLLVVTWVGLTAVMAAYLTEPEDMDHLKKFLLRARPFAFGWRPVVRQLDAPYRVEETTFRTLVSWGIALLAVVAILFGTGWLLLGPRDWGLLLMLMGVMAVLLSIGRIRHDCAGDDQSTDFLREIETLDEEQAKAAAAKRSSTPPGKRGFFSRYKTTNLVVAACSLVAAHGAASDGAYREASWRMPDAADMIRMSWFNGPPVVQAFQPEDEHLAGFRESDALLAFRSRTWGMLFDPRKMQAERLTLSETADVIGELLNPQTRDRWSPSELELRAVVDGKTYQARGGAIKTGDPGYSPIHIIESGDWYQHVAIYDLELRDSADTKLDAVSRLEIRAWGDRCLFEWFVEVPDGQQPELFISLGSDSLGARESSVSTGSRVQLGVKVSNEGMSVAAGDEGGVEVTARSLNDYSRGEPTITYSAVTDSWEVRLPKQKWPKSGKVAFNKDLLDRISRFEVKLENTSLEPRDVRIRFLHDHHPPTGYVPMMLDGSGRQTGLPLQNSKNWHLEPAKRFPYDGSWFNITTRVRLDPKARVDWEYIVAHAMWQGVPLSSAAQLCLVGWGFNGFWTQMALGAWGETLCLQPGRTMRRSFITDIRPFMVLGKDSGEPYDWTVNVGGGDIGKIIGEEGNLLFWRGAVTEYPMIGPNLSHVRVSERSENGALRMVIDSYLPRSNSTARSYFKVRIDALEDMAFKEFALFQLGCDYYNEIDVRSLVWGDSAGKTDEAQPEKARWGRVMEPVLLEGDQPWVTLVGLLNHKKNERSAATRGLVVRGYRAVIAGQPNNELWLTAARMKGHLNAELVLPPEISQLKKGDFIELLVELNVFPIASDDYYGENTGLKERLAATPDSWELTAYEADNQRILIDGSTHSFPATVKAGVEPWREFTVKSRGGMETVCVSGLPEPSTWKICELLDDRWLPLGERFPEEANPQINYNISDARWTAALSLVFPDGAGSRTFSVRPVEP